MAQVAKTIVITGASRGIGLAITKFLLKEGHNVILTARSEGPLEELRGEYSKQVKVVAGDITESSLSEKILQVVETDFQRLDGLVVNHGKLEPVDRIADLNIQEWESNFQINLFSALQLIQRVLPLLRKSEGRVILTSSGAAKSGTATWGAYCCSKAALNMMGETLAAEEPNLTVIAIRPGVVDTQMQANLRTKHFPKMLPENVKKFAAMHEQGTMLKPEQPGNVMARLALNGPKELSGKFVQWDAPELSQFQD